MAMADAILKKLRAEAGVGNSVRLQPEEINALLARLDEAEAKRQAGPPENKQQPAPAENKRTRGAR